MAHYRIPFNRPTRTDLDADYIRQALDSGKLAGDGPFTRKLPGACSNSCLVRRARC